MLCGPLDSKAIYTTLGNNALTHLLDGSEGSQF